jgi:D-psicose/D-tagatose/L-ribulose 3-epimerase
VRTAREASSLCDAIGHPRFGVTIDTFHANIEERDIPEALNSIRPHLKHIHASENDRGLLGEGHVDFRGIVATLKKIGYDGYLVIEGFGYSPQEQNGPGALWADTSVSPEAIASTGARFLNQILNEAGS